MKESPKRFTREKIFDPATEKSLVTTRGLEAAIEYLGISEKDLEGKEVLDIGSGNAHLAQELSKKGVKVYSVDAYLKPHEPIASPADLTPRFGEGSYEDAKSRAVLGLAEHLPFKDESFDLVISLFAVPYYSPNEENLEQELREMVRVLKPGGEIQLAPVFMYALLNKSNSSDRENAWHVMQVASRVIPSIPDCVFETEPYKEKVLTQRLIIRKRKTN
ncbi:MAG TPA: class I SAM-dependent methyltransferase [Candidatus Paceibacterota bacterium]